MEFNSGFKGLTENKVMTKCGRRADINLKKTTETGEK